MDTLLGKINADSQKDHAAAKAEARSDARADWWLYGLVALAVALLLIIARPMLGWWWWAWTKPESYYAHAPIIPFLSALMLWHRREALKAAAKAPSFIALIVLIPALILLVMSTKMEMEAVESFSFLLALTSSVWLLLGGKFLRAAAFPLGFLWLMAPLPGPVLNDATLHIQMLSTVLANKWLHLMTFHTVLDGNVIHLDQFSLFVDVPCSGFHLLLSLMTVSAAFAYLIDGPPKKRIGLFLFSLPLSVMVNSIRIALIGVVGDCLGSSAAHTFHDWSGAFTLMLGVASLFAIAKGIGCKTFAGWPLF